MVALLDTTVMAKGPIYGRERDDSGLCSDSSIGRRDYLTSPDENRDVKHHQSHRISGACKALHLLWGLVEP